MNHFPLVSFYLLLIWASPSQSFVFMFFFYYHFVSTVVEGLKLSLSAKLIANIIRLNIIDDNLYTFVCFLFVTRFIYDWYLFLTHIHLVSFFHTHKHINTYTKILLRWWNHQKKRISQWNSFFPSKENLFFYGIWGFFRICIKSRLYLSMLCICKKMNEDFLTQCWYYVTFFSKKNNKTWMQSLLINVSNVFL